ncbi:MAG: glutathione S-transferase family protein [Pseudomonadota bacterium]
MHRLYATPGSGNCFKPQLLMNQMGIPYETVWIDVLRGAHRSLDYLAINPEGTVPFLRLACGDELSESNAMLWALAERSDLMPEPGIETALAVQWMIVEQTKLEPFIAPARVYTTLLPHMTTEKAFEIDAWRAKAENGLNRLQRHLSKSAFMLGPRYTIVDIALFGYVHVAEEAGIDMERFPDITRWCAAVRARPGYVPMDVLAEAA